MLPNLPCFYDIVKAEEILPQREGCVDCIYLDFRNTFGRVLHKRLILKLKHGVAVKAKLLKCMKDFLD